MENFTIHSKIQLFALLLFSYISGAQTPVVNDANYCSPGEATFTATSANCSTLEWYNERGFLVGTGCTYKTGIIGFDQNYSVKNPSSSTSKTVGYSNTTNAANLQIYSGGSRDQFSVIFDAKRDFTIDEITIVYDQISWGNCSDPIALELVNGSGITIRSMIIPLTCGSATKVVHTFPVGFAVPTGNNYRLIMRDRTGTYFVRDYVYIHRNFNAGLYNSGSSLDYTEIRMKGNSSQNTMYGGMYNWKISTKGEKKLVAKDICESQNCETEGDPVLKIDFGTGSATRAALPAGTTTYNFHAMTFNGSGTVNTRPNDGDYTITNYRGNQSDWKYPGDHTASDSEGNYFLVNASFQPGEFYRTSVTGLCQNSFYNFSAYLINILRGTACDPNPQPVNVKFQIEDNSGTILRSFTTGDINKGVVTDWTKYSFKFFTGANTNVKLVLINNAPGGCGNDLAIDDIAFTYCGPSLSISSNKNLDGGFCSNEAITLTTVLGTGFSSPEYQWQRSTDGGTTWTNIATATTASFSFTYDGVSTTDYRVLAASGGNINNTACRIFSNVLRVKPLDCSSLPVNFVYLKALYKENQGNLLYWLMAEGLDKGNSIIQSSDNGTDFVTIDTLESSDNQLLYQYMDHSGGNGVKYYRILYVSDQNNHYLSKTIYTNSHDNTGSLYSVAPNPAKGHFTVFNKNTKELIKYDITDALGRLIHTTNVSEDHAQISTHDWQPGVYFIKGSTQEASLTYKLVVE